MRLGVGKGEERERERRCARIALAHGIYVGAEFTAACIRARAPPPHGNYSCKGYRGRERERGCSCERFADSEKMPPREKLMVACSLSAREKSGVFCW